MAITKTIVSNNGVTATYHKIGSIGLCENTLNIEFVSYTSQDYRSLNLPVLFSEYEFNISLEEEESMGIRQLAYKKIKELPEWEGAEDC